MQSRVSFPLTILAKKGGKSRECMSTHRILFFGWTTFSEKGEVVKKTIITVLIAGAMCIGACHPTIVTKSVKEEVDPEGKKTVTTTRTIEQTLSKGQLDSSDDVIEKLK